MWDKADIRIPFALAHVHELSSQNDDLVGGVDPKIYDFPLHAQVAMVNGAATVSEIRAQKWGSIPSSISEMAVGFFPEGNGLYKWPHVSIKASPSKILQGHNVFGSENIKPGIAQMLGNLAQAFPLIWSHLDVNAAEIRYLDSTYSAFVESEYQRNQILRVFESLFPNKDSISRYQGYLQGNKTSEYTRQKIYFKDAELTFDHEQALKKNQKDKADILGNPLLHDFAKGRTRFEATTGHRALESQAIPTNLKSFLKFHDWFESVHKEPLCRYLWGRAFNRYFDQLRGHTMKNVDDDTIRLKIQMKFDVPKTSLKTGKVTMCRRRSNSLFKTYRQIKAEGYDQLAKENNSSFFRNVKFLEQAGLSRAFLKSLDPHKPNENVVPMVQLIKVDFSQQRPDWYVEPKAGYDDPRRHLRVVA